MFGFGKKPAPKPVEVTPVHYHTWRDAEEVGPLVVKVCVTCPGLVLTIKPEARERVLAEYKAEQARKHPGPEFKVDAEVKKRPKPKKRKRPADDDYDDEY